MSFDLTLKKYRTLCQAISKRQTDCRFITYLNTQDKGGIIILRHDVDRKPKRALRMAKVESEIGIRSSYYFRSTKGSFEPKIMKAIENMGHEIGYHYEVLTKSKGNMDQALKTFEKELSSFRKIVMVDTVCYHGSPLSKFDNRKIWTESSYSEFNIRGEASLSVQDVDYYTDTGGRWGSKSNMRDNVANEGLSIRADSTFDLEKLIIKSSNNSFYINCHPERWTDSIMESSLQSGVDLATNIIKLLYRNIYNIKK